MRERDLCRREKVLLPRNKWPHFSFVGHTLCIAYKIAVVLCEERVLVIFFLIPQQSGCRNGEGKLIDSRLKFCHVSMVKSITKGQDS